MNPRVKTSDYIVSHLEDVGVRGLPPSQANNPETTLVSTRQFMYLLARYVALLLDPAGYSLRRTWEILYPALVEAHDLNNCEALINWLRVATTGTTVPGNANDVGASRIVTDLV
jgi:hypothetical protein